MKVLLNTLVVVQRFRSDAFGQGIYNKIDQSCYIRGYSCIYGALNYMCYGPGKPERGQ